MVELRLIDGCSIPFLQKMSELYHRRDLVGMLRPNEKNVDTILSKRAPYVGLIRVPCTINEIEKVIGIAEVAHRYDITVSINIILTSMYTQAEIEGMLKKLSESKFVDIVYFADSRGALLPDEVADLILMTKEICHQPIGFHAHNHLGNGLENSRIALENGCTFIDGSMNGYGYGGGNASLAGILDICSPSNPSLKKPVSDFCDKKMSLSFPNNRYMNISRLCALKNVDHIWINDLLQKYGEQTESILQSLPKRKYKTLDDVLLQIESSSIVLR